MTLRLRELRHARGLSLRALAAKAGIDHMTLDRIELGKAKPRLGTLEALARALRVPVVELFEPQAPKRRRTRR